MAKQKPGHPECDILSNVFALLSAKSLSETTADVVMDVVDSLLNTPDFEPTDELCGLRVNDCAFIQDNEMSGGKNNQETDYIDGRCFKTRLCLCGRIAGSSVHGKVLSLAHLSTCISCLCCGD